MIVRRKVDDESPWLNFQVECFGDIDQDDRVTLSTVLLTHSLIYSSGSQSVVHRPTASASLANLTGMHMVMCYSQLTES